MHEQLLRAYVWFRARTTGLVKDETGEGVISAALAVLIIAFLAALMWVAFRELWTSTSAKTKTQVDTIGG